MGEGWALKHEYVQLKCRLGFCNCTGDSRAVVVFVVRQSTCELLCLKYRFGESNEVRGANGSSCWFSAVGVNDFPRIKFPRPHMDVSVPSIIQSPQIRIIGRAAESLTVDEKSITGPGNIAPMRRRRVRGIISESTTGGSVPWAKSMTKM